ncbi:MAG: cadherin-like beta sandwich domain-containing protein, partial [Dysgonamonadaceae bacterium]|nr:cadherin-like beta sandwich domain-containing protein [Dysgonamonadaceae bacterium]
QPKTYTIVVHRKSVDATLKSITLNNGDIPFEFNPATLNYTADVSYSESSIMIAATANDSFATVSGDTVNQTLNVGDNRYSVTVTPEEGQPITYTIRVRRGAASLKSLAVSSGALSPAFDAGTLNYSVTVPNSTGSITITAETNYATAQVTGAGVKTLNVGDNSFDIAVDAEDPAIKNVYTVRVRRLSNDASLKSIRIASVDASFELSPLFDPGVYWYRASVPAETAITVSGEPGYPSATVTGFDRYSPDFFDSRDKTIPVYVVSEDGGTDRRYNIVITRQSNDASLKFIRLNPDCLTASFDPAVTYYSATVPYSVAEVEISAEPSDPLADAFPVYDLPGVKPLKAGNNRFTFSVRSEDKRNGMLYRIDIFRENSPTGIHETGTPAAMHVYSANGRLHVNTPAAERINIYSVTGTLLYGFDKPAGAFRLSAFSCHPASILIVKGSSGWVRKVMM